MALEFIDGLNTANITNFTNSTVNILSWIIVSILAIAMTVFFVYWLWKQTQYKYYAEVQKVNTTDENGRGFIDDIMLVKARFIRKTGEIHLKKFNTSVEMPKQEYWKRFNKTHKVIFQSDYNKMFVPVLPLYNKNIQSLEPSAYSVLDSLTRRVRNAAERHAMKKGMFEQYGGQIAFLFGMFVSLAIIWVVMGSLTDSAQAVGAGLQAIGEAMKTTQVIG